MPRIVGSDIDGEVVRSARKNAERAGVEENINVGRTDCSEFNADKALGPKGLVISNLPYGKRVGEGSQLAELYSRFGRHLKKVCKGWHFGFVVADYGMFRQTGLKAKSRLKFRNGGLKVEFVQGAIQ